MTRPFMRIPFTEPLPPPTIFPSTASSASGAIAALYDFITLPSRFRKCSASTPRTVILSGAGISVASGLADYRGKNGTYIRNKTYRPIYYHEFLRSHKARKRYWARSFLGWPTLAQSKPNQVHFAVKELGKLGYVSSVITQNVDSFHEYAHPELATIELHGFLRSLVCVNCHSHLSRAAFQKSLAALNPAWASFLVKLESQLPGALDVEQRYSVLNEKIKANPDGDVDVPGAPYTTFRYPACPHCLKCPPSSRDGTMAIVEADRDGALAPTSTAGILKPAVVMFGESISSETKKAAEEAVARADKMLVIGSSLATYSALRLVRQAKGLGMAVGILNIGGVRGEVDFFDNIRPDSHGEDGFRCDEDVQYILPAVAKQLKPISRLPQHKYDNTHIKASTTEL